MIKGVIFDLDGVICFTDKYHYQAWKALADREGIYFDEIINNRLRGVSRMASLEIVLERASKTYTDEEKAEMAKFKNDIYVKLLDNMTPADCSEEVRSTLMTLKEKGIKIAVGSSSKNTPKILSRLGITEMFDAVADGNCITHSKPHPEVFLKAAEMIGLQPSECYVVEDAFAGIDAANAGGFKGIAIGDAAKYDKAAFRISSFKEILPIVFPED